MTTCTYCSSLIDEGNVVCARCRSALPVQPGVAGTDSVDVPAFKPFDDLKGIGGWLILPAIGLAVSPFVMLYNIFGVDLPVLVDSKYSVFLSNHPGFSGLLTFEIIVNSAFLAGLIALNFFLYSKNRFFPKFMIAYLAAQFFLLLIDHLATVALLPSGDSSKGTIAIFRALVGAVVWIPYFLNSQRVEQTFVN